MLIFYLLLYSLNVGLQSPVCREEILHTGLEIHHLQGPRAEIAYYERYLQKCRPDAMSAARLAHRYLVASEYHKTDASRKSRNDSRKWLEKAHDFTIYATETDDAPSYGFEVRSAVFAAELDRASLIRKAALGDSVYVYAEKALERNPENHRVLSILGRWHLEVARLPWALSSMRNLLTSGISASLDQAAFFLEEAIKLHDQPDYHYWLATAYYHIGRREDAVFHWEQVAGAQGLWDESLTQKAEQRLEQMR